MRWLFIVLTVAPSWAATLDQSSVGTGLVGLIHGCCTSLAQTYTAGVTGSLLGVEVDVSSSSPYPLDIQLQSVAGGVPSGDILGDVLLGTSSSPLDSLVVFQQSIPQLAGTQYAIVVGYPTAPHDAVNIGFWSGAVDNPYPAGRELSNILGPWRGNDQFDLNFRTYVTPEPRFGTVSALAILLFVAASRKFRRPGELFGRVACMYDEGRRLPGRKHT